MRLHVNFRKRLFNEQMYESAMKVQVIHLVE